MIQIPAILVTLIILILSHSTHLKFNPEIPWVPSEADINALQTYDNSELVICGIYIRLFIANPGTFPLTTPDKLL